jgi:hypothetical protein
LLLAFVAGLVAIARPADQREATEVQISPVPSTQAAVQPAVPSQGAASTSPSAIEPTERPTSPSPAAFATAPPSTDPSATSCREQFGIADAQTLEDAAYYAQTVFIGRITAVEDARWTTPADHPPGPKSGAPEFIHTPIWLEVETSIRGGIPGSAVQTFVGGGTVRSETGGCVRFTLGGIPSDFEIGQRFAIFLMDADLMGEVARLNGIWPVVDGVVKTPADGDLDIDGFRERVAAVDYGAPFPYGPYPIERPSPTAFATAPP